MTRRLRPKHATGGAVFETVEMTTETKLKTLTQSKLRRIIDLIEGNILTVFWLKLKEHRPETN